jgi:chemotaxis protein methyltransferase CheR
MTPDTMARLAVIVEATAGLRLSPEQAYQVEIRLAPVAAGLHPPTLDGLTAALAAAPTAELRSAVTEALLSTETVFFRDREIFQHLRATVLPALAARRSAPVRVWSAACATGQEPYSLALMASDAGLSLDLCASDLSNAALQKARAGAYSQFEVQRGLPVRQLLRGFDKVDELWRVKPELRAAVRWRRFNLLEDTAPLGGFDLILCRYVLASMTAVAQRTVLTGLARALNQGGVLVLGLDEALNALPDMFEAAPGGRGLFMIRSRVSGAA